MRTTLVLGLALLFLLDAGCRDPKVAFGLGNYTSDVVTVEEHVSSTTKGLGPHSDREEIAPGKGYWRPATPTHDRLEVMVETVSGPFLSISLSPNAYAGVDLYDVPRFSARGHMAREEGAVARGIVVYNDTEQVLEVRQVSTGESGTLVFPNDHLRYASTGKGKQLLVVSVAGLVYFNIEVAEMGTEEAQVFYVKEAETSCERCNRYLSHKQPVAIESSAVQRLVEAAVIRGPSMKDVRPDLTEVTVAQYLSCVQSGVCREPDVTPGCILVAEDRSEHPANCVDWSDAAEYCDWSGGRLCTVAEWVRSAAGSDERKYPWGDIVPDCSRAVMFERTPGCGQYSTMPVGSRRDGATPEGVLDLSGNVSEWVSGYEAGAIRLALGGSFCHGFDRLKSTSGILLPKNTRSPLVGIRCCRDVVPGTTTPSPPPSTTTPAAR